MDSFFLCVLLKFHGLMTERTCRDISAVCCVWARRKGNGDRWISLSEDFEFLLWLLEWNTRVRKMNGLFQRYWKTDSLLRRSQIPRHFLQCSQQLTASQYPGPNKSIPYHFTIFFLRSILMPLYLYALFPKGQYYLISQTEILYAFFRRVPKIAKSYC